jgi:hypothetical protein
MTHKIPPFIPLNSSLIDDKRVKRLNKELPNSSGFGILMGLYFHLIREEELKISYQDIDIIADELRTSVPLITTVIESYNLFAITKDDNGKKFFSPMLNQSLQPYFDKCETNSINAKIGANKRKAKQKQQLEELKQLSQGNSSKPSLNECSANIREEKRREEKRKEKKKNDNAIQDFIGEKIVLKKFVESRSVKDEFIYKVKDITEKEENKYCLTLEDIYDNKIEKAKTLLTYEEIEKYIKQNKYIEKTH